MNVPSADVTGNKSTEIVLAFDATIAVETDRIRLWITGATDNTARVSEIRVWPASVGNVPPMPIKLDLLSPVSIYLNQSGFNAGAPKRFTAPKPPTAPPSPSAPPPVAKRFSKASGAAGCGGGAAWMGGICNGLPDNETSGTVARPPFHRPRSASRPPPERLMLPP